MHLLVFFVTTCLAYGAGLNKHEPADVGARCRALPMVVSLVQLQYIAHIGTAEDLVNDTESILLQSNAQVAMNVEPEPADAVEPEKSPLIQRSAQVEGLQVAAQAHPKLAKPHPHSLAFAKSVIANSLDPGLSSNTSSESFILPGTQQSSNISSASSTPQVINVSSSLSVTSRWPTALAKLLLQKSNMWMSLCQSLSQTRDSKLFGVMGMISVLIFVLFVVLSLVVHSGEAQEKEARAKIPLKMLLHTAGGSDEVHQATAFHPASLRDFHDMEKRGFGASCVHK